MLEKMKISSHHPLMIRTMKMKLITKMKRVGMRITTKMLGRKPVNIKATPVNETSITLPDRISKVIVLHVLALKINKI